MDTQINQQTMQNDGGSAVQVSNTAETAMPMANISELMALSKKTKEMKPVIELSSTYIELEKVGDDFRGIYAGTTTITVTDQDSGEMREITAARFIIDGKMRLNAGAVLVSELKSTGVPVGAPLEVKYTRKEGRTKIYSLTLLG